MKWSVYRIDIWHRNKNQQTVSAGWGIRVKNTSIFYIQPYQKFFLDIFRLGTHLTSICHFFGLSICLYII